MSCMITRGGAWQGWGHGGRGEVAAELGRAEEPSGVRLSAVTRAARYRLLLVAVVLAFVALSLALTDLHRYLAYDEAIYLSQVYPGPALPFTAPRARGMPVLLAPLGWIDAPLPLIRSYLLLVNAGLMYLGFNAWLPVLRGRAVAAAAVFAVAWLPLFYSTEAFPNLPVAFGLLAAAGYLARYLCAGPETRSRRALLACAVAIALVGLFRPTEASFVTAGLAVAAALIRPGAPSRPGRELALRWAVLAAGLAIGWAPWLIEAQLRFGGPRARLRAAGANVGSGFHPENLRYHLGYTDGPLAGAVRGGIPRLGELWWLLMIVSIVVLIGRAVASTIRKDDRPGDDVARAGSVAALVGVAAASQYLFLTSVLEARFLLPSYAVLTVALMAALPPWPLNPRADSRRADGRWATVALALASVLVFAVFARWQVGVDRGIEAGQDGDRRLAATLAQVIRQQNTTRQRTAQQRTTPCFVASDLAFPVIAFEAGCRGGIFHPAGSRIVVHPDGPATAPPPVYVLTRTNPEATRVRPVTGSVRSLTGDGATGWWFFVAVPTQVIFAR
jgi:hypothetical protein